MNKFTLLLLLIIATQAINAQSNNAKYNKAMADSLGADDYGMKTYVLVILKTGTGKIDNKVKVDSMNLFLKYHDDVKKKDF